MRFHAFAAHFSCEMFPHESPCVLLHNLPEISYFLAVTRFACEISCFLALMRIS
jgi:hypothetical protein